MSGVLLDDVARYIRRFVVITPTQADAIALWVAHTHVADAAETTPYLSVTSPTKRSGKSRLREALELVVHEPLSVSNISDAALFRAVSEKVPALLLDEADAIFKAREREDLRGMLNAGYRRGAVVYRMGGKQMTELQPFEVFCPKAFFGIGDFLPDTIVDRAIPVRLKPKTREETVERFRRREVEPDGFELRDRLADWLEPQIDHLFAARPHLPDELDDRAQDSWEPLLAIAELAGGDWPARALETALALSSPEAREDDESMAKRLLADIHSVFETTGAERFKTADLIDELCKIEESPWGDWYGKTLSAQALSKLLRDWRIKTLPVWAEGKTVRGYKAEQFADAFHRVLDVRSVRNVRSDSPSQAAPNTPNAPNAGYRKQGSLPGDDDFLDYIATVHQAGHITTDEALMRESIHAFITRGRESDELDWSTEELPA